MLTTLVQELEFLQKPVQKQLLFDVFILIRAQLKLLEGVAEIPTDFKCSFNTSGVFNYQDDVLEWSTRSEIQIVSSPANSSYKSSSLYEYHFCPRQMSFDSLLRDLFSIVDYPYCTTPPTKAMMSSLSKKFLDMIFSRHTLCRHEKYSPNTASGMLKQACSSSPCWKFCQ